MMLLLIKLIIAQIIGDFVFQPDSWVEDKKINKQKSKYLYLHGLVHLISLLVILEFKWSYWPYIITIVVSHLIIDIVKINFEGIINSRILFVTDQILHLIIINIVVYLIYPYTLEFDKIYSKEILLLTLAILLITSVSSIVMKIIMSNWELKENKEESSLKNAGKYIGVLERLFVFGFIVLNQWSAIGLLITAKSVFRFNDLSKAKDRRLTEYILIGTLISFGLAILIGISYKYLMQMI